MTGEKIPLEAGIRFAKLSQELTDDPSHREDLFAFVRQYQEGGLMGLLVADDAQEAVSLLDAWRGCGQPLAFSRFLDGVNSVQASLETVDFYASAPMGKTLGEVLKRYVRGVVGAVSEGQIDWQTVQLAIMAFDDLVNRAYKLPMPVQLPPQRSFRESFTDFVMAHGHHPDALGIIEPVVVELWIDEVVHHQKKDGTGGGDPDEARRHFYQVLGLHLEESASETTGDTPLELDRFEGIISGLVARGRLPSGYRLLDVGSRSGERILRPLIRRLTQSGMGPGTVVASDADPYPPPDAAWEFVLADFTEEGFPDRVGAPFDLMTHAWSPINDETEGWNQQRAINNFSRSLAPGGYMVMDIPVGYEEEKLAYALAHGTPLGRIKKAFETQSGLTVAKDFMVNELYDLVLRMTRAGLRVVNLSQRENPVPDVAARWTTGQGNERMTLVLEKVRESQETLDLVWVGAGVPT